MSLENEFIDNAIKTERSVTVFLTNGVKLQGVIDNHDDRCMTLTRDGVTQLLYKHGVSTVMPPEGISHA